MEFTILGRVRGTLLCGFIVKLLNVYGVDRMDFLFNEEQKLFRDTISKLVTDRIEPFLASYPEEPLPREACMKIMDMLKPYGLLSSRLPEDEGGSGLGPVGLGLAVEALPYEAYEVVMPLEVVALRVSMGGTRELKAKIIPQLLSGNKLAGGANSEPNVGSNPREIQTKAVPDGDSYVINGTKIWCTGGSLADILLIVASTGKDDKGRNILTPIVIERDKSPFEARSLDLLGIKRAHLSEVVLDNCRVPKENLLSDAEGHGHKILTASWISQRPIIGLCSTRIARKAYEAAVIYAGQRKQFGKAIASFQLVQNMLTEMATLIDASRLLCYRALLLAQNGVWCAKESSMAKYYAAEASLKVTNLAVEVHGAFGITKEYAVEKYYRDARVVAFPDGTIEIQKLIVGREITGIRAFA